MLYLSLVSRWVHILSMVVAVGGTIFLRFVLHPAAVRVLSSEQMAELRSAVVARWRVVVHACVGLLLVSGGINFWMALLTKPEPVYHALFGVKLLAAIVVFFLAIALTSSRMTLFADRSKALRWAAIMAAIAIGVIMLSGVLKHLPRGA